MGISGLSAINPSALAELTELSESFGQPVAAGNVTDGGDGEAAFALLYSEALEVSAAQEFEISEEHWDEREGLQAHEASGPFTEAMGLKRIGGKCRAIGGISNMGQFLSRIQQSPLSSPRPDSAGVLNKSMLADWMDAHALTRSSHRCAMFCRQGLQAAGLSTEDRPRSGDAGDYGPFLVSHGAHVVPPDGYTPQVGDTVVFEKTEQHPNGHIEMFDGRQWVSDFLQHNFSPYRDSGGTPPFTIYRLS